MFDKKQEKIEYKQIQDRMVIQSELYAKPT
jgi:hypothetical protein